MLNGSVRHFPGAGGAKAQEAPAQSAAGALDAFDRAILAILQVNNATPQRVIAEQVNLSAAAVQRRVRRLEDTGVITANVAVVDPAALGQAITVFVQIELASESAAEIAAAKRRFLAASEVQQCYYVTGDFDFLLVVLVPTMSAYEGLTQRLFFQDSNVRKFKTIVAMDRVKTSLQVPT